MEALKILNSYANRQGWNEKSQLDLAILFIENHANKEGWENFLIQQSDNETLDDSEENQEEEEEEDIDPEEYYFGDPKQ
jgi:hypothetical protein